MGLVLKFCEIDNIGSRRVIFKLMNWTTILVMISMLKACFIS
jgi:hypothetical protein